MGRKIMEGGRQEHPNPDDGGAFPRLAAPQTPVTHEDAVALTHRAAELTAPEADLQRRKEVLDRRERELPQRRRRLDADNSKALEGLRRAVERTSALEARQVVTSRQLAQLRSVVLDVIVLVPLHQDTQLASRLAAYGVAPPSVGARGATGSGGAVGVGGGGGAAPRGAARTSVGEEEDSDEEGELGAAEMNRMADQLSRVSADLSATVARIRQPQACGEHPAQPRVATVVVAWLQRGGWRTLAELAAWLKGMV